LLFGITLIPLLLEQLSKVLNSCPSGLILAAKNSRLLMIGCVGDLPVNLRHLVTQLTERLMNCNLLAETLSMLLGNY